MMTELGSDDEDDQLLALALVIHHKITVRPTQCVKELIGLLEGDKARADFDNVVPRSSNLVVFGKIFTLLKVCLHF